MPRRYRAPTVPCIAVVAVLAVAAAAQAAARSPTGCRVNGTVYGEGSAMLPSSHCEYCYCIKGRQHCVRPHCILDVPSCKPQYNKHSCCPIKYHCSDLKNYTATSPTTSSTMLKATDGNCKINGSSYLEGEKIEGVGDQCENCYCMKSKVICEPTSCPIPLETCRPVHSPGHCCPTSYNCSDVEPTTEYSTEVATTVLSTTLFTIMATSKIDTESTLSEETTPTTTFEPLTNETELRSLTESDTLTEEGTTMHTTPYDLTTTSNIPANASSNPVRSIPDVLEAIINRTLAKDDDYEYDYNEPSLPPSLPNLKIIPFVAADAVLNEQEYNSHLEGKTEMPLYLDAPKPNRFSPPSKTEGGFVPRDPVIDGPFYESKFEKPFTNEKVPQVELTSETLLPPITEPAKLFEEGKCDKDGQTYHHGEVVSEPNACELCVCYYKQVHCQQPKCNPVKPGCHRIKEKDNCCGREICDQTPPRLVESEVHVTTPLPESMSNIPAITVADLIVTPNPFKDVIRTEPAPDLDVIMKDLLPHLLNDSTSENPTIPVSIHPGNVNHSYHETHHKPSTITQGTDEFGQNKTSSVENEGSNQGQLTKSEIVKNITEDYDDSFSFSSVLDMLFRGDAPSKKIEKPITSTSEKPETKNYDNIQASLHKQEINNAIESLDNDYYAQKNKVIDKTNDYSTFQDYQADESRNDTKENTGPVDKLESKMDTDRTELINSGNKTIKEDIGSGILKLAGCNIYGRMYRVGRIISELSSPCLECMCTEFGVQCRKLC